MHVCVYVCGDVCQCMHACGGMSAHAWLCACSDSMQVLALTQHAGASSPHHTRKAKVVKGGEGVERGGGRERDHQCVSVMDMTSAAL